MKLDKLFKVLVMGGAVLGGAASCGTPSTTAADMVSIPDMRPPIDWVPPEINDGGDCRCTGTTQDSCYCNGNMCCWLVNDPCCSTCHPT